MKIAEFRMIQESNIATEPRKLFIDKKSLTKVDHSMQPTRYPKERKVV